MTHTDLDIRNQVWDAFSSNAQQFIKKKERVFILL